jgi:outer membrane lipoprotein-sorting protein
MKGISAVAAAALLALVFALAGISQDTRVVYGTVRDGGEVVRGAVVQLENLNSLEVRSYITQKNGEYHFAQLNSNTDYQVWAQRDDKRSSKKMVSRFNSDKRLRIDLDLK